MPTTHIHKWSEALGACCSAYQEVLDTEHAISDTDVLSKCSKVVEVSMFLYVACFYYPNMNSYVEYSFKTYESLCAFVNPISVYFVGIAAQEYC